MHPAHFQFLRPTFRYAVIGATTNKEKYGYRVLKDLASAGLLVVGVNPKYTLIDTIPVFPNVAAIPQRPDVAVIVIPPENGLAVLDALHTAGISKVWFQPGAESEAIRTRTKAFGMTAMADGSCIMVARRRLGMRRAESSSFEAH